jgi:FAD/FMN-containing dehydrogenase
MNPTKHQPMIDLFVKALGAAYVLTGEAIEPKYKTDWQHTAVREPLVVLRPSDTAQVAAIMKICHQHDHSVTVQGGMTGLVAGGLPDDGQVVISMERLNGVEEIDPASSTMTVWAGTPLQLVQEAATKANLYFAVDLGARGSCQVGGNISTNAGGNRVIRYGMMREQILGLEVVLADGTIVTSLNKMLKNNAGYDLKQLFIGSEGTLGIVTRAVLRLHARTPGYFTAFCALATPDAAVQFLAHLKQTGGALMSYEVMWPDFYDFMTQRVPGIRTPLPTRAAAYALIELATDLSEHDQTRYSALLETAMEYGWVTDAAIAQSGKEAADFWRLRDAVSEFPVLWSPYRGYDISLPIGDMSRFVASLQAAFTAEFPTSEYAHFGHIGDSNLHVVIHVPGTRAAFPAAAIDACVYEMVRKFGGSISAEHGIGLNKKKYLHYTRNASEMALMKLIKSTLDPKNLLNPGKVI